MSLPLDQVILGDCVDVMAEWPENSVDCIVTDPNYGIGFMGLDWDKALPPRGAFEQMIRVLKPGALAFVMSSPRQDVLWRMLSMLEGVGFELNQSYIEWIYKTGFPKAYDVSKVIDKKLGLEREAIGSKGLHSWDSEKGSLRNHYGNYKGDFEKADQLTAPSSDLAKKWEGWKSQTGLKPAHEPILMANKPFSESTIVGNVLRWGTGAINVDATRIPFNGEIKTTKRTVPKSEGTKMGRFKENTNLATPSSKGRFPANLLVSDVDLDTGKREKGTGHFNKKVRMEGHTLYEGGFKDFEQEERYLKDEGSPYRYFDLDAWAERHGFLDVAKPSRKERNFGLWGLPRGAPPGSKRSQPAEGRENPLGKPRANYHPTVKPLSLMAYLIELGCPPGGVVVDPFVGSGTTCVVAKRLRRKWIGIEINPEYVDIARARIDIKGPLDQFLEADG